MENPVGTTAKPPCRVDLGRADHLPVGKGSVDPCLAGHALARKSRRATFSCPPLVLEEMHLSPLVSTNHRAFPAEGTPELQPEIALSNDAGYAGPH
jgi:hypothetical protein